MKNRWFRIAFLSLVVMGCHQGNPSSASLDQAEISPYRDKISKEPVADYKEKVDNPLNNWYFSVQLYETKNTFNYLIRMQFEEVRGEDTLRLPNFGMEPKPSIRKGKDRYSCIIGFLDRENQFRPCKMVSAPEGKDLKITTLSHYTVVSAPAGK